MGPMAATIERITPGRGRAGDTVTVTGSGFSAAAGRNGVTVGGVAATVLTETATAIAVLVPAGITQDKFLDVVVSNLTDATSATHRWWSKASLATLRALRLPVTVHGQVEQEAGATTAQVAEVAEARDWERALSLLEVLQRDTLTAKGYLAARATTATSPVVARAQQGMSGGRQLATTDTAEILLPANASDSIATSQGEGQVVLAAGKMVMIAILCRRATPTGSNINRVRIFVNGTAAYDSNNEAVVDRPSVVAGDVWVGYPWLTVAAGDRIQVGVTKSNGTSTMNLFARALVH